MIQIVECPRDAMQGLPFFVETPNKIVYLQQLLKVGFHTLDFGSFVSPKAIPQMRDTAEVLNSLDLSKTTTKLLAIVANVRGALEAASQDGIHYLGYPFSISETFQIRNTNATMEESLERVESIMDICRAHQKEVVLYLSMGFGNPYGDPWSPESAAEWVSILVNLGAKIISLSDTIGIGTPDTIGQMFYYLSRTFPDITFGAHLHTQPHNWEEKVRAAFDNGCRRFDGAIRGFGGCPMARDELTGNMPTEYLLAFFKKKGIDTGIDEEAFFQAEKMCQQIFIQ